MYSTNADKSAIDEVKDTRERSTVAADNPVAIRVVRKFDTHIMPWLFGLWFFAALDRANIGLD